MRLSIALAASASAFFATSFAAAATLKVGPGQTFSAPCAAVAAASDGDVIEIDASGSYDGDVCAIAKNGLTLRGVGGRPKIDAAGQNAQSKAIWVISGDDTTVENIELSGASVQDQNGAAIRQEGKNLTVRGCYFHDNENGILAGDNAESEILIEMTELSQNGFGDGFSHNLYINHIKKFTLQYSYSHSAKVGHLVKSRAAENHILYNRLTGELGTESYEIDLPNGGLSFVIGNLIQQGDTTDNAGMLAYQQEGPNAANPIDALFAIHNTFVNERQNGGTFLSIGGSVVTPLIARNNVFAGPGTVCTQASATLEGNYSGDPLFVDQANFDYHLTEGSPAVDMGVDPGTGSGQPLDAIAQYVHPANFEGRTTIGVIDVGAYELGGGSVTTGVGGGSSATSTTSGGAGGNAAATSGGSVTSGEGGGGAADNTSSGEDSGCSCRAAGGDKGGGFRVATALAAVLLLAGSRLRRAKRR